ncbi:hypothetical protein AT575_06015 [Streptococcus penaeicida]|uniref:DNA-binding protein n=1 Tax=Streptococcus penaeicida TaxID=1765960 RepID=A0A2N8LBC1_9STRE|nr:hypothetical protein [Streptococcus penaeicida]PND47461.1 hypothetical protein AT575_06015 [Streptococcus penaeicida]
MSWLSNDAFKEILDEVDKHLEKRLELERQNNDGWDLVSRQVVLEKLGISQATILKWEKCGLKSYQSPFENSKKIYYRKSDIYNFLSVE